MYSMIELLIESSYCLSGSKRVAQPLEWDICNWEALSINRCFLTRLLLSK